jgi:hypothetical protein
MHKTRSTPEKMAPFARVIIAIALAVSPLFSAGCALGDRNISLLYDTVASESPGSGKTVAVVKFKEMRQRQEVGEVRNGYGMKLAKVYAKDQDVGAWVANALCSELENSGISVNKFEDAAPPSASIVIEGTVPEAYVKMYMTRRGTVRTHVVVTKAGVTVLDREYAGTSSALTWVASSGEYESSLKLALQDLMKKLVPDIVRALE